MTMASLPGSNDRSEPNGTLPALTFGEVFLDLKLEAQSWNGADKFVSFN